jgi:hypothetical protein
MWYLQVSARPVPLSLQAAEFSGAFINCWIDAETEGAAIQLVRDVLKSDGWLVDSIRESYPVTRETQSAKGMPYFNEAEQVGIATLAFTWPRESDENQNA